ncbi:hypothetical protein AB0I72_07985 [Nocardiopsis sp. NPDC049922]|uniref:hypothetical protein n=1 Tax=Nocardiopsis sp. NPDC049922 TaxID=3155157 RepID=UPI0033EE7111
MKLEKHYDGTRPVFDPTLPEAMLQGLRAESVEIQEAPAGSRPRLLRTRRERLITGGAAFTATLIAMAVCLFVLDATGWSVLVGVTGMFLYIPLHLPKGGIKEELTYLFMGCLTSLGGLGAVTLGVFHPSLAVLAPCLLIHLVRYPYFVYLGERAVYVVPADRFVDPSTLGIGERKKLRWIRNACDRVERAERLIPGFDGRSALIVLREEEWIVARDLARIAPLSAKVERFKAEAASDRVRSAVRPQVAAVEAANRGVERRRGRIAAYMRPVDGALTAYREWEQLSQLPGSVDDYIDLIARGGSDPAGPLPHDLHGDPALHAARDAVDERVREANEAAVWLISETQEHG